MEKPCFFCDVQVQPDQKKIIENATCFARFDDFPVSDGHALIATKRHVFSVFDMNDDEVSDMLALLKEVRSTIEKNAMPDGYTVGFNVGEAAGQTIPHVHLQVIPRHRGDVENPRGGIRNILAGGDYSAAAKAANRDMYL